MDILETIAALPAFKSHDKENRNALHWAAKDMQTNLEGYVIRCYLVPCDWAYWKFGDLRWHFLKDPSGNRFHPNDPMKARDEPISLVEFQNYLENWYWPTRKADPATIKVVSS